MVYRGYKRERSGPHCFGLMAGIEEEGNPLAPSAGRFRNLSAFTAGKSLMINAAGKLMQLHESQIKKNRFSG